MSLSKRYQWMKPCRMILQVDRDVMLIRKELSSLWPVRAILVAATNIEMVGCPVTTKLP